MSDMPEGATWEATDSLGQRGIIFLETKDSIMDVWVWKVYYSDGTFKEKNWGTSYRMCRDAIALKSPFRMRRVTNERDAG